MPEIAGVISGIRFSAGIVCVDQSDGASSSSHLHQVFQTDIEI
jgi:hypothetical protein